MPLLFGKARGRAAAWAIHAVPAAFALCLAVSAHADDDASATPYKLTIGDYYVYGGGMPSGPGLDINLRRDFDNGHVWIGGFRSAAMDIQQPRAGWDDSFALGSFRLLPSLQVASGGFLGGSLALETGDTWYAGAGLGRTNLKPYANLNFDPNDSFALYGGYKWPDATSISLMLVRDDRENPNQQNVHLVWQQPLADKQRLTVDLLAKQGTVNGEFIRGLGLTLTYDWARWFVRLAYDPYVNFTPQNMIRLSVGSRF